MTSIIYSIWLIHYSESERIIDINRPNLLIKLFIKEKKSLSSY